MIGDSDAARPPRVLFSWSPSDGHRLLAFLALIGALGAIALAVLGLPPVGIHGPLHRFGIMDPACGMTRATQALARNDLARAWRFNPGSFGVAAVGALLLLRFAYGTASGRWLEIAIRRTRTLDVAIATGVAALWINQQLHAAMLR